MKRFYARAGGLVLAILCAGAHAEARGPTPNRLLVTRTKDNLNNTGAPPFHAAVSDPAVAKLYADISALPPFPAGPMNCPNDMGIRYHLDFYAGASLALAADYQPTGCVSVRLRDGTVKSDPAGSFKTDFEHALGFASDRQLFGLQ